MPQIKVLSYNVRGLRDDRAALHTIVRQVRPDVALIQEAPSRLRWRPRCAGLARECGLLYAAGGRTAGGNLLLVSSRIDVHAVEELRIPQRAREPIRGVVAATLGLEKVRFAAVGIHLGLSSLGRRRDVRDVLGVLRVRRDLPIVLGGDLNEPVGGPSWREFAAAGMHDPATSVEPGDGGPSAGDLDPHAPTFPAAGPRTRIDAIFVGPGADVADYGVPTKADLRYQLVRATDHLPVVAVVDLPG
ncbi:endonuclease/exonuclease/phosphatase family protein [Actinopolymorpha sp. B11F2]|uniref:endonuclease/exonuclease/phosphatase family protein n=1 Tax=Actinopolymorpha sp. B11F2 TaxID=3160862 RepID=UPI0032E4A5D6